MHAGAVLARLGHARRADHGSDGERQILLHGQQMQLGLAQGEPRLGLPALGGLFAATQCPDLDKAQLTNAALLAAMESMRWTRTPGGPLAPIDYRNMGTEELGSVYESLLELVPEASAQETNWLASHPPVAERAEAIRGNAERWAETAR